MTSFRLYLHQVVRRTGARRESSCRMYLLVIIQLVVRLWTKIAQAAAATRSCRTARRNGRATDVQPSGSLVSWIGWVNLRRAPDRGPANLAASSRARALERQSGASSTFYGHFAAGLCCALANCWPAAVPLGPARRASARLGDALPGSGEPAVGLRQTLSLLARCCQWAGAPVAGRLCPCPAPVRAASRAVIRNPRSSPTNWTNWA